MHRIPDALREEQQTNSGNTPLTVVHKAVEELNSEGELRGSITVLDELGCQLTLDETNDELYNQQGESAEATQELLVPTAVTKPTRKRKTGEYTGESGLHVDCSSNPNLDKIWDAADAKKAEGSAITAKCEDRFIKICKQHKIPFELHSRYREWLKQTCAKSDGTAIRNEDIPFGTGARGHTVTPKLKFPKPPGSVWRKMKRHKDVSGLAESSANHRLETLAVQQVVQEVAEQKEETRKAGRACFAKKCNPMIRDPGLRAMAAKAKPKRRKAIASGEVAEPSSTREALQRDHQKWIPSIVEEVKPLFDKGVLCQGPGDKGYTKAELLAEGIDIDVRKAVYVGLYHTHKHGNSEGEIDRHKTRCAVKGQGQHAKGYALHRNFCCNSTRRLWKNYGSFDLFA